MGLYNKKHTPADEGFAAARLENSEEARLERKKKFDDSLAERVKLDDKRKAEHNKEKEDNKAQILKLHVMIAEQTEKINSLIESDKKVHENISEEEEHEFVESVESFNSGGNIMLDIIRFKHTDIVIIVGETGLTVWESMEDFDESLSSGVMENMLFDLELEEMEKVDISDEPERKKTGIEKLDALIETYDQINNDAEPGDTVMELKAKNYDYYVEELNAHNYDEEQKNLFLGWLSKQK